MQVADNRMTASVGFRMVGSVTVFDPDLAGGGHHGNTHGLSSSLGSVGFASLVLQSWARLSQHCPGPCWESLS